MLPSVGSQLAVMTRLFQSGTPAPIMHVIWNNSLVVESEAGGLVIQVRFLVVPFCLCTGMSSSAIGRLPVHIDESG